MGVSFKLLCHQYTPLIMFAKYKKSLNLRSVFSFFVQNMHIFNIIVSHYPFSSIVFSQLKEDGHEFRTSCIYTWVNVNLKPTNLIPCQTTFPFLLMEKTRLSQLIQFHDVEHLEKDAVFR